MQRFLVPMLLSMSPLLTWEPGISGGVNVALPTNITAEDVAKVINEAELVGMACSVDELATLAPVLGALPHAARLHRHGPRGLHQPPAARAGPAGAPPRRRLLPYHWHA